MYNNIMKKTRSTLSFGLIFAAVFGLCITSLSAQGKKSKERHYGAAGCGFGSVIFAGGSNDKVEQILAFFTNQTFTQTSSISSGTSNCHEDSVAFLEHRQAQFVAVNYSSLSQEIAVGKGEKLDSLVSLLGCSTQPSSFVDMVQKNHGYLFSVPQNQPLEFIHRVKAKIKTDAKLATACQA